MHGASTRSEVLFRFSFFFFEKREFPTQHARASYARTNTNARLLTLHACRCAPLRRAVRRLRSARCVHLCRARCRSYHGGGRARRSRRRRRRHPARGGHRARQGASSHSRLSALLLPFTRCHLTLCSTRHLSLFFAAPARRRRHRRRRLARVRARGRRAQAQARQGAFCPASPRALHAHAVQHAFFACRAPRASC